MAYEPRLDSSIGLGEKKNPAQSVTPDSDCAGSFPNRERSTPEVSTRDLFLGARILPNVDRITMQRAEIFLFCRHRPCVAGSYPFR